MNKPEKKQSYWKWGTALLIIIAFVFIIKTLPQGFSEDLSIIGQGTFVAVAVHNKEDLRSEHLLVMINDVRNEYANRIEFRIADTSDQLGKAFAKTQKVSGASIVMFDKNGQRVAELFNIDDTAMLKTKLNKTLNK